MLKALSSALGLVVALSTPALAGQSWEDLSLRTALAATDGAVPAGITRTTVVQSHAFAPASTTPGVFAVSITTGLNQTGVPCLSCVSGAQTSQNVGLSSPLGYIPTSIGSLQYAFIYQDVSVTAKCGISLVASAGTSILFKATVRLSLVPGAYYLTASGGNRPTYSGAALLVGKVACPGSTAQVVKQSLYFQ